MKEFIGSIFLASGMMLLFIAILVSVPLTILFLMILMVIFGIPSFVIYVATRLLE